MRRSNLRLAYPPVQVEQSQMRGLFSMLSLNLLVKILSEKWYVGQVYLVLYCLTSGMSDMWGVGHVAPDKIFSDKWE